MKLFDNILLNSSGDTNVHISAIINKKLAAKYQFTKTEQNIFLNRYGEMGFGTSIQIDKNAKYTNSVIEKAQKIKSKTKNK